MRHGEELEIVHDGIRISSKAVEPLGIMHGSQCWGLWVQGQRRTQKHDERLTPHLVISPIHPDYWTSVFHLKMKLRDEVGALAQVTALLKELRVNILFSDCAPSGFKQATFTAICELQSVRGMATEILDAKQFPESSLFRDPNPLLRRATRSGNSRKSASHSWFTSRGCRR